MSVYIQDTCAYIYTYICTEHTYVYMYICVYRIHVHTYICTYMCTEHMYVCTYVSTEHMYICIYVHMCKTITCDTHTSVTKCPMQFADFHVECVMRSSSNCYHVTHVPTPYTQKIFHPNLSLSQEHDKSTFSQM